MAFEGIQANITTITPIVPLTLTGATWNIDVNNRAFNTPTLGSELIGNGTFASDTAWTKGTGWTIGSGVATATAALSSSLNQVALTIGLWYTAVFTITVITVGTIRTRIGNNFGNNKTVAGTYTNSGRCLLSTVAGIATSSNTASTGSIDNVSFKLITLSTVFSTFNFGKIAAKIAAKIFSRDSDQPCGVVGWLDSAVTPANFIIAYFYDTSLLVDKCVAGTYTNVLTSAVTFVQDGELTLEELIGDQFRVIYNGSQVGNNITISDAGIINNTIYGLFSTSSSNLFSEIFFE